ncbi:hypothetical protein FOXG_22977 [Fusarium oxysporum f. sp. lycopersici 4287]|uniref:Transcription factor domain-containing protein n=2 Tax=Fusarium oxysporum TaxID=5507 RepID=A0A0J9W8E7_FUSO4|nr:hypothetical protein FOXG_16769 [Fusarium oxysporum f. sp. lycopersici 4287]XP_018258871.1 uncharacterized protein FOXG_22977 [Fusarium oxysporum f. sp. lycopersici 4287]EXK24129.1 hypothetical protein FOMG_19132 [Fusarium oxysporum f. sp. melonis 26406]KAJ9413190.1 hypothetical protein QL093DRAFT_2569943 [Fusarium oxysporum]KNB19504.1 hypothetical protein FOXG_16769 [Fusarium oxysporum f. sp. lycopersici 4287]KNB20826.1 hypothetical protein FOXG_22977 [Fusarium oxysporum f. sp. lycopersici
MSSENDPLIQVTQSPLQGFSARCVGHSVPENPTSPANGFANFSNVLADMEFEGLQQADDYFVQRPENDMKERQVDPLFIFNKDEMIRLCRLYEEAFDCMLPVISVQSLITHTENLTSVESVKDQMSPEPTSGIEMLQLKVVICCALVIQGGDQGEKAARIYENMGNITDQMIKYDTNSTPNLAFLALLANYQLLSQNDVLAWRTTWQLARSCLRKGLHRRRGLMVIEESDERKYALNVFWTAYVFGQQLGFDTGLPCVIRQGDIDKELPLPETYPYLVAMITWTRIGIRVWRRWDCLGTPPIPEHPSETVDVLGKEILQWYETLPEQIKVSNLPGGRLSLTARSQDLDRPKTLICFKLLQMRIWLYMPVLCSRSTTTANLKQSQHAVSLATSTVRYLSSLKDTNLDHMTQSFYPRFLLSTIMIFFLASIHAPVYFAGTCRADFYAAIELTKSFRVKDWLSQRLWRAVQSLKNVAPRFGLDLDEYQSMVTAWMMSSRNGYLESNLIGEIEVQTPTSLSHQPSDELLSGATSNGIQIWTELSYIFEAFTSPSGFGYEQGNDAQSPSRIVHSLTSEPTTEQDRTVFLIFKDLIQVGCSGLWEGF